MKIRKGRELVIAGVAITLFYAWVPSALAQAPPALAQSPVAGFPNVIEALRATPGCLGVETAQTASGRRVIFAWFENKKTLVDWYYGDVHQKAMKTVFPNTTFDRKPLPDLAEDSGPILAIVSVKFADTPSAEATPPQISSIGIELYGPLPGGVAVGGRFAPAAVKVRGLREIDVATATGQPRTPNTPPNRETPGPNVPNREARGPSESNRETASPAGDLVAQALQALDGDRVDQAIALLERAVAADPNDPTALARLGSAQVRKARTAQLFDAPGWVSKGFTTMDDAVARFPDAFIVYLARGIAATQVPDFFGKAPVAVKDLSTLVTMKDQRPAAVPDAVMPSVYLHLGRAYKKVGQTADARAAWEKGKLLYPTAREIQAIDKELR